MYRFLIVDDEPNMVSVLRRVLAGIPMSELDGDMPEVETFLSPRMALERAAVAKFDLVISDLRMPDMNGIEFLTALMAIQPDVVRFCMSGDNERPADGRAIEPCHWFGKPWRNAELRSAIAESLARKRAG